MISAISLKKKIFVTAIFVTDSKKSYIGRPRENPGIHPSYHLCDFSSKTTILA